jgi:hypothetical protein
MLDHGEPVLLAELGRHLRRVVRVVRDLDDPVLLGQFRSFLRMKA